MVYCCCDFPRSFPAMMVSIASYGVLVGKSLSVRVPGLSSWIYLSRVFVQAFVVIEEDEETPTTDDYRANRRMCKQLRFDIFRYPIDCVRD